MVGFGVTLIYLHADYFNTVQVISDKPFFLFGYKDTSIKDIRLYSTLTLVQRRRVNRHWISA